VRTIRMAMCQMICLDGDRAGNFVRIENALSEARSAQADIACFPETTILGWVNPEAHERAYPIPGEDTKRLSELAVKYQIHICIGLAEKSQDDLFDSVVLMDDTGNILLKHRKINLLQELMTPPYTPGTKIKTVDTPFGRIGLLICADTFQEEILIRMADQKPDLLLIPYGWAAEEGSWPEHGKALEKVVINAARKTGAAVVGTDLVGIISHGSWTGRVYGGQSIAVDSRGNVLARGKDRERDIMIFPISLNTKSTTT
jgi:N-carbamoylputrescine amidase